VNLRRGNVLSVDQGSLSIELDSDGSTLTQTLKFLFKGTKVASELMEQYYFTDKMDFRGSLILSSISRSIFPAKINIEKLVISDDYFKHNVNGLLALEMPENKVEGDLIFSVSQEVKRPYSPALQKEHLDKVLKTLSLDLPENMKFPERKLFRMIKCQGDTHFEGSLNTGMLENWKIDIRQCKLKFGAKYELNLIGNAKGPDRKAKFDLEFVNYHLLKHFIERKFSNELLPILLFIEELASQEKKHSLNFQVKYDGPDRYTIGNLPISECVQKAKASILN